MSEARRTLPEVLEYFGVSRSTLYRWIDRGWIAAPIAYGRKLVWYESSIRKAEQGFIDRAESGMPDNPGYKSP